MSYRDLEAQRPAPPHYIFNRASEEGEKNRDALRDMMMIGIGAETQPVLVFTHLSWRGNSFA
jgi:hypothetical protein